MFGLDDSDLEDFLASSSDEETVPAHLVAAVGPPPQVVILTGTGWRGPKEGLSGDVSRPVPPNRL